MLPRSLPRRPIAGPFALILLAAAAAPAGAADVTVTRAEIAGGKLVITGTTATANTRLRLDGRPGAAFNAISDGRKKFKFRVAYLPSDCIVTLDRLTRSTVAASDDVVVANCARGLSPRGDWVKATDYSVNDLVTHDGSSWVARRDNISSPPGGGGDWQLFAAAGADGSAGSADDAGEAEDRPASARRVPPTGAAGGDLAGTYPNPTIKANAVTTAKIVDGTVTGADVANDSLTAADIATNAVGTAELADFAVVAGRLAPNAVSSTKIVDGSIANADLGVSSVTAAKIADGAVTTAKLAVGAVGRGQIGPSAVVSAHVLDDAFGGGLGPGDLAANSVGASEIQASAVGSSEIATNAVGASEIVDFGLSNQDIGVLFAEVNADGTLAHSSGGVTSTITLAGNYTVDFGRAISSCTAVATLGQAGSGTPPEGVIGVSDRQGNAEAVHVRIMDTAHSSQNFPFRLIVVC